MSTPELTLGRQTIPTDGCITWEEAAPYVQSVVAALGNPGPAGPGDTVYNVVYYDGANIQTAGGDTIVITGGGAIEVDYAGTPVVVAATKLNFTGDFTITDAGGGQADINVTLAAGGSQNLFETIRVSGQSDVVADSTTDILTFVEGTGIVITTSTGGDSVTFAATVSKVLYKGEAVGAVTNDDLTCLVDNVTAYNGDSIVASSADQVRVRCSPRIACADNTVIFFEYSPGILASPATDYTSALMLNWKIIWAGVKDYDPTENMLPGHRAGGDDLPRWDTVDGWLKTITDYASDEEQYLKNDNGTIRWVTVSECP